MCVCVCVRVCVYIYIYIYREREREIVNDRESSHTAVHEVAESDMT